jgi:hypothetical protein
LAPTGVEARLSAIEEQLAVLSARLEAMAQPASQRAGASGKPASARAKRAGAAGAAGSAKGARSTRRTASAPQPRSERAS